MTCLLKIVGYLICTSFVRQRLSICETTSTAEQRNNDRHCLECPISSYTCVAPSFYSVIVKEAWHIFYFYIQLYYYSENRNKPEIKAECILIEPHTGGIFLRPLCKSFPEQLSVIFVLVNGQFPPSFPSSMETAVLSKNTIQ